MTSRKYWILAVAAGICVVVILAVKIRRYTSHVVDSGAYQPVERDVTEEQVEDMPGPLSDANLHKADISSDLEEPAFAKAFNRTSHKRYSSIQSAIDNATDGDVIEAAACTHYESIDFKGKSITVRSFDPDDWDVVEKTIIDANGREKAVYFHNSEDANSVLKGFKITGGARRGIYCNGASPTVANCLITGNGEDDEGGGMYNRNGASPNVTNCVFSYNNAEIGGGMYNDESSPTVTNCVFAENWVEDYGAGMYNGEGASPTVTNCVFYSNEAEDQHGGGMYNNQSSPTIINCTFYRNESDGGYGGAIYNRRHSNATLSNCIFWYNFAKGASDEIYNKDSEPTFSYCCIRGGLNGSRCGGDDSIDGGGNINDSPDFYNRRNPDGADDVWGTSDDGLRLKGDSPCIDAGDNSTITEPDDITGNTRKIDDPNTMDTGNGRAPIVDMGAYEYDPGS